MSLRYSQVDFRYRARQWVLKDLDFTFPSGSTLLLGPNGAGKSTILGLGASALSPQRGSVTYQGQSYGSMRDRSLYRRKVAWMPQQIQAIPGLTAREQVAYVGWLKGMGRRTAWEASVDALEAAGLTEHAERKAKELSGGQLRRLGVAQSVVHEADLVLMDEPTAGLDLQQRRRFRELIGRLRTRADLVVSTHQAEDIAESYDTVVVLSRGQILHATSVEEFLSLAPQEVADGRKAEAAYGYVLSESGHRSE